jgi:hypothetical protein
MTRKTKNSPNQVEAIPDKQIILKMNTFYSFEQIYKKLRENNCGFLRNGTYTISLW